MKYKRRTNTSIDMDFQYYIAVVGLYHYFYGHRLTRNETQKVNYIWKTLLKQYI